MLKILILKQKEENLYTELTNGLSKKLEKIRPFLFIIDGLDASFGAMDHRTRASLIRKSLQILKSLAVSLDCAILFTCHAGNCQMNYSAESYTGKLTPIGGDAIPSYSDYLYLIRFGKAKAGMDGRVLKDLKKSNEIVFYISTNGEIVPLTELEKIKQGKPNNEK